MTTPTKLVDVLANKATKVLVGTHGFIELLDVMPRLIPEGETADNAIARAARVSYTGGTKSINDDHSLVRRLYRDKHTSPFEMVSFQFRIKSPIFVNRQLFRHRTASLNEESGRYSIIKDDFYRPSTARMQSKNNKQGSDGTVDIQTSNEYYQYLEDVENLYDDYRNLVNKGVSREIARIGLPLSTYSSYIIKFNLHNLLQTLRLRMADDAQLEIREYADAAFDLIQPIVPVTCKAYQDYTQNSITFGAEEVEAIKNNSPNMIKNMTERKQFLMKWDKLRMEDK